MFIKIKKNNLIKIIVIPLLEGPIKILNSLCKILYKLIQNIIYREGINQYKQGKKNKTKSDLNQFIEKNLCSRIKWGK